MPKDALTIYRAALELNMLVGGRVDKVTMPNADTLILLFHTASGNHRLLLSCNPSLPRAHITALAYKNPETATGTLMYFRKRLTGATLTGVNAYRSERMLCLAFSALDELRERVSYSLNVELTGKCANIVFVAQNGVIGTSLRRVSAEVEGKRAVFAGLEYTPPTPTGRIDVFDGQALKSRVSQFTGLCARAAVCKSVAGLADSTVNEIFNRLGISDDVMPSDEVTDLFIAAAKKLYDAPLNPVVTFDEHDGKPLDYFIAPYAACGGKSVFYPTLNAAMDAYYSKLFEAADFAAYIKPLRAAVKSAFAKISNRYFSAVEQLMEIRNADKDRLIGDLILSNIYRIKRGDSSVTVENYEPNYDRIMTIELDVTLTPQQNAAKHYKQYTKKKRAAVYAEKIRDASLEIMYKLERISFELDMCTEKSELDEVRAELVALGFIRPEQNRKKQKPVTSEPYRFDIDGATLLVGKNSAQNDRITRGAARTDTWLHVRNAHGAHAVLKTANPTDAQLLRAAEIAAYYSQNRASDHVAVDYTLISYVYPHGGGKVDYKEYKTLFVTPTP